MNKNIIIFKLNAGNTNMGNPRRLYIAMNNNVLLSVYDEEHSGKNAVPLELQQYINGVELATTIKEYNYLIKYYNNKKIEL